MRYKLIDVIWRFENNVTNNCRCGLTICPPPRLDKLYPNSLKKELNNMTVVSKFLAAFALVCAIYFVSGSRIVFADDEFDLEGGACAGTACQICKCKYNACVNNGHWQPGCSASFYNCVGSDYTCTQP